jgi:hypothetical protein
MLLPNIILFFEDLKVSTKPYGLTTNQAVAPENKEQAIIKGACVIVTSV